jgi:hypothetical protein
MQRSSQTPPNARRPRLLPLLFVAVLAAGSSGRPAFALVQFGQFSNDGSNSFVWNNDRNTSADFFTVDGGAPGFFTLTNVPGLPPELQGPQAVHMTVSASTVTDGFTINNQLSQPISGIITIQVTRDTPDPNLPTGNLLTVRLTSGTTQLTGSGASAALVAATPRDNVTYSSDLINFSNSTASAFTLGLTSITPALSFNTDGGRNFLNSFTAAGSALFSANLPPAVPEPASVVLLGLGGVALVGFRLRTARRVAARVVCRPQEPSNRETRLSRPQAGFLLSGRRNQSSHSYDRSWATAGKACPFR